MRDNIKRIVIVLLLAALVSASMLLVWHIRLKREAEDYKKLAALISSTPPGLETSAEAAAENGAEPVQTCEDKTTASDGQVVLKKYASFYEQNHDLIGWLKIDGTTIDYPVMQTPLNGEYYISRDFTGKSSSCGTLFADAACSLKPADTVSDNIIIYGHNMRNGTMFGALMNYKHEEFLASHPVIRFDTIYEQAQYEIIAVFYSRVYTKSDNTFKFYNFIDAEDQSAFKAYADTVKSLSIADTGTAAEYGDKLMTLCTCSYQVQNGRFIVVAKK